MNDRRDARGTALAIAAGRPGVGRRTLLAGLEAALRGCGRRTVLAGAGDDADALERLRRRHDVVLVDGGGGNAPALARLGACDHGILVTTGTAAAIADTYQLLKALARERTGAALHLVVNRARSRDDAELVWGRLRDCGERFLGRELHWLGMLPDDGHVAAAAARGRTFAVEFPDTIAATHLARVVAALARYLPGEAGVGPAKLQG